MMINSFYYSTIYPIKMLFHRQIALHVAAAEATRRSLQDPIPTQSTNMNQTAYSVLLGLIVAFFVTGCLLVVFRKALTHACCGIDEDFAGNDDVHTGGEHRRRSSSDGLSREVIDTFPLYYYTDVKAHQIGSTGELECAICLNHFVDKEKLRLLPRCNHVFHPQCIDKWLQTQATCPVCRTDYHRSQSRSSSPDILLIEEDEDDDQEEALSDSHGSIINQPSPDQITTVQDDQDQVDQLPQISTTAGLRQMVHWPVRSSSVSRNFPKFHSTGHSPFWTAEENERFTLRLSVEARRKLAVSGPWRWFNNGSGGLPQMASPRDSYDESMMTSDSRLLDWRIKSDRLEFRRNPKGAAGSEVDISRPGSSTSDGVVDYLSLVTGEKDCFQVSM